METAATVELNYLWYRATQWRWLKTIYPAYCVSCIICKSPKDRADLSVSIYSASEVDDRVRDTWLWQWLRRTIVSPSVRGLKRVSRALPPSLCFFLSFSHSFFDVQITVHHEKEPERCDRRQCQSVFLENSMDKEIPCFLFFPSLTWPCIPAHMTASLLLIALVTSALAMEELIIIEFATHHMMKLMMCRN